MFSEPEKSGNASDAAPKREEIAGNEQSSIAEDVSFTTRHPHLAGALLFAALLLFVGLSLLILSRRPNPRNAPQFLLAHNFSTSSENLPALAQWKLEFSAEELAFGREQFARMVKDRPELARSVYETDPIWQFCVRGFAGAAIGEPILWDSNPPGNGYPAEHLGPYKGTRGYIRLRKTYDSGENRGKLLACEELWAGLVFEIENIRNWAATLELHQRALAGQLTREEYIVASTKHEYGSLHRLSEDYARFWRPLAIERGLSITPSIWGLDAPPTYAQWISLYNDPAGYPWDAFGRYYDEQIKPYLSSTGRMPKVSAQPRKRTQTTKAEQN